MRLLTCLQPRLDLGDTLLDNGFLSMVPFISDRALRLLRIFLGSFALAGVVASLNLQAEGFVQNLTKGVYV